MPPSLPLLLLESGENQSWGERGAKREQGLGSQGTGAEERSWGPRIQSRAQHGAGGSRSEDRWHGSGSVHLHRRGRHPVLAIMNEHYWLLWSEIPETFSDTQKTTCTLGARADTNPCVWLPPCFLWGSMPCLKGA